MRATEIIEKIKEGSLTHSQVVSGCLDRIDKTNPALNAVISTYSGIGDKIAKRQNSAGALEGVPVLVKDNFCVAGEKTSAASKMLADFISPYTAFCLQKMEEQGALLIGRTNMDEFGMGSSNENSVYGPVRNPWDTTKVPGGSSGGSAAAVAAGFVPLALGSDTGGSIRQPASFCGVVGVKPTYGSVSRYGLIAFASSLDQPGLFAGNVADAALGLQSMIAKDPRDATNVTHPGGDLRLDQAMDWQKLRVGVVKSFATAQLDGDIEKAFKETTKIIEEAGGTIVEVDLSHAQYAIPVYYLVAASEASSNLARYDGVRYGYRSPLNQDNKSLKQFYKDNRSEAFGEEVKRRILLGTYALSAGYCDAYYTQACRVRRLIAKNFQQAFSQCDFIISPVTTESAFAIGDRNKDPLKMYYNDQLTTPASLAGIPAMSLPVALSDKGLPIGLQIMAPSFQDAAMLSFAQALEEKVDFCEVPHA